MKNWTAENHKGKHWFGYTKFKLYKNEEDYYVIHFFFIWKFGFGIHLPKKRCYF